MVDRTGIRESAVTGILLETAEIVKQGRDLRHTQLPGIQPQPPPQGQDLRADPRGVLFLEVEIPLQLAVFRGKRGHIGVEPRFQVIDRPGVQHIRAMLQFCFISRLCIKTNLQSCPMSRSGQVSYNFMSVQPRKSGHADNLDLCPGSSGIIRYPIRYETGGYRSAIWINSIL